MAAVVEVPPKKAGGLGIRIFDDAAIRAAVDKATSALPVGRTGAVVAYVDTDKTVKLAVTAKLGDQWSVVAEGVKEYQKPIKGQAMVVFSWPRRS